MITAFMSENFLTFVHGMNPSCISQVRSFRRLIALLLLLQVSAVGFLKAVHTHAPMPGHDHACCFEEGAVPGFHSKDGGDTHCFVCDFTFAPYEESLPEEAGFFTVLSGLLPVEDSSVTPLSVLSFVSLRAPPVSIS